MEIFLVIAKLIFLILIIFFIVLIGIFLFFYQKLQLNLTKIETTLKNLQKKESENNQKLPVLTLFNIALPFTQVLLRWFLRIR